MRMNLFQTGFTSQAFDQIPETHPIQWPALLTNKQAVDIRRHVHLIPHSQPAFESRRLAVENRMRTRDASLAPTYIDFARLEVNIAQAKSAQFARAQSMPERQEDQAKIAF